MTTTIISSPDYTGLVSKQNSTLSNSPWDGHRLTFLLNSEMQSELPLWSSGLEGLGYSDPFPKFSRRSPTYDHDQMEDDQDFSVNPVFELDGTEEEKGWKFYIGSICNRRTTNDLVSDMWRQGEKGWTKDIPDLLKKTLGAEHVVSSWYEPPSSQT